MPVKAGNEIFLRVPLMEEQRLLQFLAESNQLFEIIKLVFLRRIHPVIIQSAFPHRHDLRIGKNDFLDPFQILVRSVISSMGMDTRRAINIMGFHELIHKLILPRFRARKNAADPRRFRVRNNPLRIRKRTGK